MTPNRSPEFPQRFKIGDVVGVRRFDEIDKVENGDIPKTEHDCFSLNDLYINGQSALGLSFLIDHVEQNYSTYLYHLTTITGQPRSYWWTQGMLYGYDIEEEVESPDSDNLFGFLFG